MTALQRLSDTIAARRTADPDSKSTLMIITVVWLVSALEITRSNWTVLVMRMV